MRKRLPAASRALKGWHLTYPSKSKLPLPLSYVSLFALLLSIGGFPRYGMGLLIGFAAFLRPTELISLRKEDVLLPHTHLSEGRVCGLHISKAKGGRNQFARIQDPHAVAVLAALYANTPPGGRLFPGATGAKFNSLLRWCCAILDITDKFTLHSLRHGRASQDFLNDLDPRLIQRSGRWRSEHGMEPYLQACAAFLLILRCPPATSALLEFAPFIREHFLLFLPST